MKSITQIYKQGMGPSSTLNMVPYQACMDVVAEVRLKRCKVSHVEVNLYNEYARLAKEAGIHLDIEYAFALANFKYVVNTDKPCPPAIKNKPFVFDIIVYDKPDNQLLKHRVEAVGGANYVVSDKKKREFFQYNSFEEIKEWFKKNPGKSYFDFACQADDPEAIRSLYYRGVNLAEIACLQGLRRNGELKLEDPNIHYLRQARIIWVHDENILSPAENANRIISAFSYAISEEIVEKRVLVAAPTVCTTPVIWSVILYLLNDYDIPPTKMLNAFCAAGIFASLMDAKASLDSSVVGCQGPMGTACGMAAVIAAVALFDAKIDECGRAFEMAIEHSLGLICDAINALPIIPCIQRCSSYATRAFEIARLNNCLMKTPELCKLDDIFQVLMETGSDLIPKNRRLGMGGFAEHAKYSLDKPTAKDWE